MHKGYRVFPLFLLVLASELAAATESGGVTIGGTRLIFDGGKKEASLSVSNSDTGPYLIQSWVEPNNNDPARPPFIITPPLFRLDGNQQNLLRIVNTGGQLPTDRESLYWLNVKAIPTNTAPENANTLQIAPQAYLSPQHAEGYPGRGDP